MPPRKLGPALFALACIGLALYHRYRPLDATFIGLILLAAVPWFAPWLAPLISSLKVGGLELNFRDLKAQVDENTKMVKATAAAVLPVVMQPPAAVNSEAAKAARASAGNDEFVSHGVPLSSKSDEAGEADVLANSDPNKGAFGGRAERDGYSLEAEVTPMPQSSDFFLVHAWVESTGRRPLRDGTEVVFHLHPTFKERVVTVKAAGGAAPIDRIAWGSFTLGAEVDGLRLELDLATQVPSAPALFRGR